MKKRRFALAMAFVLALALTGCSANREGDTNPMETANNAAGSNDGVQNSQNVGGVQNGDDGNDALQGGGAGGTNDLDNDGLPEGSGDSQSRSWTNNSNSQSQSRSNNGGSVMDDIGRAAGDLTRGAGNAVRDAGNAIGNAANDIGRAIR